MAGQKISFSGIKALTDTKRVVKCKQAIHIIGKAGNLSKSGQAYLLSFKAIKGETIKIKSGHD